MIGAVGLRHVTVVASDLAASLAFYDAALEPLGIGRIADYPDEEEDDAAVEAAGYGLPSAGALLWVVAGLPPTTGAHLAFDAPSGPDGGAASVAAFHAAAMEHGGVSRRAPRRWAIYRPGYFGAVVADPDGNLIEAIAAE